MKEKFFRKADAPIHIPESGPGAAEAPSPEIHAAMGEENIKAMLRDFYEKLGESAIAGMFPRELIKASEKSALFFIGLLGGPPIYMETYGPPRMRARHLPFRITEAHRKEWLACFYKVLEHPERYQFPLEHLEGFKRFLDGFSAWMVNTAED
jgi:hemoglobin